MRIVIIFMTLHGIKCTNLQFPDLKPQRYYVPIVNIMGVNQSILYYKDNHNNILINSILKEVFTDQPVMLLSGENITTRGMNSKYSNIILLTESLNIEDFQSEAFKNLLFSHWSTLYLVITLRSRNYTCENGTLNRNAFNETKSYLNELWQLFRIARVVVSFPYTCPNHYVIYDGKERSGTAVYNRTIKIIRPNNKQELAKAIAYSGNSNQLTKDYPLRISLFYRFPTSIQECDVVSRYTSMDSNVNGFCGLDGLIAKDYVGHYKYNLSVESKDDCNIYGFMDTEKSNITTGSLGCIVREEIDISFNSRFLWAYTAEDHSYSYLHHVAQDSLCVVMKRPSKLPLWHYAANVFSPVNWTILLASLIFLGTFTWMLGKISARFYNEKPLELWSYLMNATTTTLFGLLVLKNDGRFLIFKGTSLLSSVILLAVYQGHLNYHFTTLSHYREIKTLEQLYNSRCVLYTSHSIAELLKPAFDLRNEQQAAFFQRMQLRSSVSTEILVNVSEYLLENSDTATLARKEDFKVEVLQNFTDKNGKPLLYAIGECYSQFYLSYIARKGFIFNEESVKFFMRLLEAGLPSQYYIWTQRTFNLAENWPGTGPEPRPFTPISLMKLRIAFGLLLTGYVVSGIVFMIEKWKGSRKPTNIAVSSLYK